MDIGRLICDDCANSCEVDLTWVICHCRCRPANNLDVDAMVSFVVGVSDCFRCCCCWIATTVTGMNPADGLSIPLVITELNRALLVFLSLSITKLVGHQFGGKVIGLDVKNVQCLKQEDAESCVLMRGL